MHSVLDIADGMEAVPLYMDGGETIAPVTPEDDRKKPKNVYANLAKWDLSKIKAYMVERNIYSAEEIDEVEKEYKRFLALVLTAEKDELLPISLQVDPFWHIHILHTDNYRQMSRAFGREYISHYPTMLIDRVLVKVFYTEGTLVKYEQNFGKPNPIYWPPNQQCCGDSPSYSGGESADIEKHK